MIDYATDAYQCNGCKAELPLEMRRTSKAENWKEVFSLNLDNWRVVEHYCPECWESKAAEA